MIQTVSILDEEIHYIVQGAGRPLVILHGNRASASAMMPLISSLSETYKVYAPDMSGFGKSTYHRRKVRVEDYAKEMVRFLEVLEIEDAVVIGWSFGGVVAQELAKITARLRGVVLLSSVGPEGISFLSMTSDADKYARLDRTEAKRERMKEMFEELFVEGDLPRRYVHLLEEALAQKNPLDVYFAMRHYQLEHPAQVPMLILHGEDDRVVGLDDAIALKRYYPKARLEILMGGHFLIYNDCEEVLRRIQDFLKELET